MHIQLYDFMIGSPLPLPKVLRYPSRLVLKFWVNGVGQREVLSTHEDAEDGVWEADGSITIYRDQLLTVTVLVCVEDSTKELGAVTIGYSQLLAHAEARSKECYEFILGGSISSVLMLITCSTKTSAVSPPRKQRIASETDFPPVKSEDNEGHSTSNRTLIPDASSTPSVVDLEHYYGEAASLLAEHKSQAFNAIGCAYRSMYDTTNEMGHLERAISILGDALQSASFHPGLPEYLDNFAICFLKRFKRTGNHDDIENAISRSQDAVHIAGTSDTNRHRYILHHAIALLERFGYLGKIEDLQSGISFMTTAVELVPDGHRDKPAYLNNSGNAFEARFNRLGRIEDLEISIAYNEKAVDLTPDDHPDKPAFLSNLGTGLDARFHRLGHDEDVEAAIVHMQRAVDLTPDGHPHKPVYLNNLGNAFETRFEQLGHVKYLEIAITHNQKAVDLIPDGHPDKPRYLFNLGEAFEVRFGRLGHIEDLEIAIVLIQKAVDLTLDSHPDKPQSLGQLGCAFWLRFDRLGHIEDLEMSIVHNQKAVDLTPDGHPVKPSRLSDLGTAFETRFSRLGHIEDLKMSIAHKQKAVDLTPDNHPDKPLCLHNLSMAFLTRFHWLGCVNDLEIAIVHQQSAVDLIPDGDPSKPKSLGQLGTILWTRFDRLGRVDDLEVAIAHKQKAVDLTPDGHPDKPGRLSNLGNAYKTQFERFGRIKDLEMAIRHHQSAVELTPDGHPDKPKCLSNLGNAFESRFDLLGHIKNMEMAIAYKQSSIDLTPDGHPDKPGRLTNLGTAFKTRFDQLGHIEDLEIAIVHKQSAVDLTPDSHPEKPLCLNNLGTAFKMRFYRLGRVEDLERAAIQFSTAALLQMGSPIIRLKAAREWALAVELLEASGVSISSPLEPYHVLIDLLPRVAWLGIPMSSQHALLEQVGGTVREAVSTAIKLEEYETAVEWAEAGRSIVWQNLLNLRMPVNELRSAYCDLADRLETISRQLDMSVKGVNSRMDGAVNGMKKPSRSHVQLALDWDNTVADIRSKPGFESFLKPKHFNQLGRIVRDGPIVILNTTKERCDALIIIPEDNDNAYISSISLDDFSYLKGEALLKELKSLLSSKHLRARGSRLQRRRPIDNGNGPPLQHILRCLWLDVVKPIVDALAYQPRSRDLPHIWWCATGPLAFLPIHAAGLYGIDELGSKLSDYVVSSYTPTLSALLNDSPPSQEDFRLLAIAQANAPGASPIPKTEVEVKKIQTLAKDVNFDIMTKEDATIENVWHGMERSSWVHLACHGQQNIKEPMKSGLLLHDGTLELQKLIEKPLPLADFAFLSACQTATGDESVAEESLHLAAGMLFAGYKGVIATMWSIMDDVGPRVAEDVYRVMLKGGKPNRKAAAYALHEAVKQLREDPKVDLLHWVPFIHIGL